jgi:hypothetical protein
MRNEQADREYLLQTVSVKTLQALLDGEMPPSCLTGCFIFSHTRQGLNYWYKQKKNLVNGKPMAKTVRTYLEDLIKAAIKFNERNERREP